MGASGPFLKTLVFAAVFCADPVSSDVLTQRYNQERTGSVSQLGLNQNTVQDPRWGLVGKLDVQGTAVGRCEFAGSNRTERD